MADIYIVRQRIKGALQFTGAALVMAALATWYFHHQLEFEGDRNRFILSGLITAALGIAWIGLLFFHISAVKTVNTANNYTDRFDNLPWWFLKITALLVVIGVISAFIVRNSSRADSEFDLLRGGNLTELEARIQENPALAARAEKKGGLTLVQTAFREKHSKALALLLKYGAAKEELADAGRNPVFVSFNNLPMLEVLLESGFDPDGTDAEGIPPIHHAVAQEALSVLDLLLVSGAKVDARDGLFRTPLMRAIDADNTDIAEILLASGADINAFDKRGDTVLHIAVRRKNEEIVRFLIEKKADAKIFNFVHMTALHVAALGGQNELVRLFADLPDMVDLQEEGGRAPLDYALKAHKYETADLLIVAGADVNRILQNGGTLLHETIGARDYQTARYLIRNGADSDIPDSKGETAWDVMRRKELTGLLELVEGNSSGAETNLVESVEM